jgi:hypothetical protein
MLVPFSYNLSDDGFHPTTLVMRSSFQSVMGFWEIGKLSVRVGVRAEEFRVLG